MENNVNTRKEDVGRKKKFNFVDFLTLICLLVTIAVLLNLIVTLERHKRGSGYADDVIVSIVEQIDGRLSEDSNQDIYKFLLEEIGVEGKRVGDGLEVPLGYRDYTCVVKCESYSDTVVLSTSYFSDNVKSAVIDRETGEVEYSWE